ncbi:MAG: hypothetical protein AAFQ17_06505, partial [Pseudomonadota bacterium]
KLAAMDTTNVRSTWNFTIGPLNPTPATALATVNGYVASLVGDETVVADYEAQPSRFIYCIIDNIFVCYQAISLKRTVASPDTTWSGNLGVNSRIAWRSNDIVIPLKAVYRFARTL